MLGDLVAVVAEVVEQRLSVLLDGLELIIRGLAHMHVLALVAGEGVDLALHQVQDRLVVDGRHAHGNRLVAEPALDGRQRVVEVGTRAVHLVDEHHPRNIEAVGLTPHRLGLGLDATPPSMTMTAPSSTRMDRSTSMVKST